MKWLFVERLEPHKTLTEMIIQYLLVLPQKKNPKIALAIYVEGGGWGSDMAVPIGSLCIEKYISKEIKREKLEDYILTKIIEY